MVILMVRTFPQDLMKLTCRQQKLVTGENNNYSVIENLQISLFVRSVSNLNPWVG